MAISKVLIASILLSLLVLNGVQAVQTNQVTSNNTVNTQKIDCGDLCIARCKLSGRPNLCKRACETCCDTCQCVPPGTYGNYEACPCYAKLTTHDSKPKCP